MTDWTDIGGSGVQCGTTVGWLGKWTEAVSRKEKSQIVLERYWKPVYAHIRLTKGLDNEETKELTQSFFTDKIVAGGLVEAYVPGKAKFRTFLKKSVDNYVNGWIRAQIAQKRRPPGGLASLENVEEQHWSAINYTVDIDGSFDRTHTRAFIEEAMANARARLINRGERACWSAFEEKVVRPILADRNEPTLEKLGRILDVSLVPGTLSKQVSKARNEVRQALRDLIGEYAASVDEVDAEFRDLMRLASEDGAKPPE